MAQLTPIRGFADTPISKSFCIITTLLALISSILQWKNYLKLIIDPYLVEYRQYWRLVAYQWAVINESDYMLVVLLWFHFKNLERFYGSNKYFSLVIVFALYNSLACLLVMYLGQTLLFFVTYLVKSIIISGEDIPLYQITKFNEIIPGPLGIISSLYVAYGRNIPISYYAKILISNPLKKTNSESEVSEAIPNNSKELTITSHFQIHVIYTLLLLNNGFKSIIPCLVGLFIGKLYVQELLPGSRTWILHASATKLFTNPLRSIMDGLNSIRGRFDSSYRAVETEPHVRDSNTTAEEIVEIEDEERNEDAGIRAETPVRPLGSQFLDTFRT